MATVNFYTQADMFASMLNYKGVVSSTLSATSIYLGDGTQTGYLGGFTGSFQYTPTALTGGSVTFFMNTLNKTPQSAYLNNAPTDIFTITSYIQNKDSVGLAKLLLSGDDMIFTSSLAAYSNTVHGYAGNDFIFGSAGNETLYGDDGNDDITGYGGNDYIDGGAGIDTAEYSGNRSSYTVLRTNASTSVSGSAVGSDTLVNVERLIFSNETLALDINGNAGQAYRVYQAAFNRTPDNTGLKYWINQMDSGSTLTQVASGFIASQEFASIYGSNPTTDQFVTRLYNNVLHRAPEQAGYNYWVNAINNGTYTKATALAGFSESTENQAGVIGVIQNGIALFN